MIHFNIHDIFVNISGNFALYLLEFVEFAEFGKTCEVFAPRCFVFLLKFKLNTFIIKLIRSLINALYNHKHSSSFIKLNLILSRLFIISLIIKHSVFNRKKDELKTKIDALTRAGKEKESWKFKGQTVTIEFQHVVEIIKVCI